MRYKCKFCDKTYSSMPSRSNHIKNIHKDKKSEQYINFDKIKFNNDIKNKYMCNFCDKSYKHFQSRWTHEQKCKIIIKPIIKNEIEKVKNENLEIRKVIENIKNDSKKMTNQLINIIIDKNKTIEELKDISNNHMNELKKSNDENKDDINIKIIKEKDNELKIKLLENICIKKQKRINYSEENVIYIVTNEDNKKKRIYIIGKAKILKNRLSTYNKTSEHEIIYFKGCTTIELMNMIEKIVLLKLDFYKEKANRDRFILPIEKDISLFINIINESIDFFNKDKLISKEIEI